MSRIRANLSFANIMSVLAVFIALGGTAIAITTAKRNSVTSKSVRNASLKGIDVLDESLTGQDVDEGTLQLPDGLAPSGAAGGDLAGTYPNPTIRSGAVDAGRLAANLADTLDQNDIAEGGVGASELSDDLEDTITPNDIATGAVESLELGDDLDDTLNQDDIAVGGVGASEVADASLDAADVAVATGQVGTNLADIAAGGCVSPTINPAGVGDISTDVVVVTPNTGFSGNFSIHPEVDADTFDIKICNVGTVLANPDGAGGSIHWMIFNR